MLDPPCLILRPNGLFFVNVHPSSSINPSYLLTFTVKQGFHVFTAFVLIFQWTSHWPSSGWSKCTSGVLMAKPMGVYQTWRIDQWHFLRFFTRLSQENHRSAGESPEEKAQKNGGFTPWDFCPRFQLQGIHETLGKKTIGTSSGPPVRVVRSHPFLSWPGAG